MSDERPWTLRPYGRPLDADFVVTAWLRSWARSRHGRALGAHESHSPQRAAFWEAHEPHVRHVLASATTTIMCRPGSPDTIMAFVCTGPEVVHYVLAKHDYHDAGVSESMFRALLGERLTLPQSMSHELVELRKAGMGVPLTWREDFYFWSRRAA